MKATTEKKVEAVYTVIGDTDAFKAFRAVEGNKDIRCQHVPVLGGYLAFSESASIEQIHDALVEGYTMKAKKDAEHFFSAYIDSRWGKTAQESKEAKEAERKAKAVERAEVKAVLKKAKESPEVKAQLEAAKKLYQEQVKAMLLKAVGTSNPAATAGAVQA